MANNKPENEDVADSNIPIVAQPDAIINKNSQSLVDIANNTFKELCRTLENEQTKLLELEERRKKLQEEMQRLKAEIEEAKQSYDLNLIESTTDNTDIKGADSSISVESELSQSQSKLDTCYEVDENNECIDDSNQVATDNEVFEDMSNGTEA